jgi:hypothetical protein
MCNYSHIGVNMNELELLQAEIEKSKFILENSLNIVKKMLESEKKQFEAIDYSIKQFLKTKQGEDGL